MVTVGSSSSSNQAPTVLISSPSDGATYAAGTPIPVSATARDSDGTVESVGFYIDSVLYAQYSYTSSYVVSSISLPNVAPGVHMFTAFARDNSGASTTSAPVKLTVGSSSSSSQ